MDKNIVQEIRGNTQRELRAVEKIRIVAESGMWPEGRAV